MSPVGPIDALIKTIVEKKEQCDHVGIEVGNVFGQIVKTAL